MITAQNQGELARLQRLADNLREFFSGPDDRFEVFQVWVADRVTLRLRDCNIALIFHCMTEALQMFTQIGIADGARPDVHATPVRAQVHRRTNNTNTHQLFLLFPVEQLVFRFSHSFIIAGKETIDKRSGSVYETRKSWPQRNRAVAGSSMSRRRYICIITSRRSR